MIDTRTITVQGIFGQDRQINKSDFVARWAALAYDLANLDIFVIQETKRAAEKRFEELYSKEHPNG